VNPQLQSGDVQQIDQFDDPRLDDYRNLKDNLLQDRSNKFVAESFAVVLQLLQSNHAVSSLMLTESRWHRLRETREFQTRTEKTTVYIVSQTVMDQVTGFNVHRGCLAIGVRPPSPQFAPGSRLIVALEDLVDVDNVGGIVRNACAFGADGILLSPKAADPYYRKAIRVAMGNTFRLPIVRATTWPDALLAVREQLSATLIGAVVQADGAKPLRSLSPSSDKARILVFGAEGPGLKPATRSICDELCTIPMANADSLNVATAAAVFLFQLLAPTNS